MYKCVIGTCTGVHVHTKMDMMCSLYAMGASILDKCFDSYFYLVL